MLNILRVRFMVKTVKFIKAEVIIVTCLSFTKCKYSSMKVRMSRHKKCMWKPYAGW
jgi:hypothetical protein